MKPLLLIGSGGHTKSVIDVVESLGTWQILGLIGLPDEVGHKVLGYSVLASDDELSDIRQLCGNVVISIGQIGLSIKRRHLQFVLSNLDFNFPSIVSPYAIVSRHSSIGCGTTIGHNAIVNAGAIVGNHCILNTGSLVEHDAVISDFCHVSTYALVNGNVRIGSGSFIGSGSLLREGIELPDNTVISAGKRVMGWPLREETVS